VTTINGGVLEGVRQAGAKVRDLSVTGGLPGVPLGVRMRGATTFGPPVTGTAKPGDEVPDRNGTIWICTAGGTPGTWKGAAGSAFLCTPTSYAPASQVTLETVSAVFTPLLASATTVAAGSNGGEISTIASWSSPSAGVLDVASVAASWPSSGTVAVSASGSTVAIVTYAGTSGGNQLTGCVYVSGSATGTVTTGGVVSLTSGIAAVASTGSFTAPVSGSVVVTAGFTVSAGSASGVGFGLALHGTTTMVGNSTIVKFTNSNPGPVSITFLVTGLTAGSSYNLDLMWAATLGITLSILAIGQTSASPNLSSGSQGSPVVMTAQAV
jgi:hypothetical protein